MMALACLILFSSGCRPPAADSGRFSLVVGAPGHTAGRFNRPRGLVVDEARALLYVVDWDGRIQKFTTDGRFRASWIMPDIEKGKPEDLCLTPRGTLLVTDTHYSRIIEFSADGALLKQFGSYGKEPGQFIYPVGIVCDSKGNIYVSEYGENDRIQKFSPAGEFLIAWGRFGSAPGEFQRPSGLTVGANDTLFVADAVNHRIQVFDGDGRLLRAIGREGTGPGEFRYPYDVAVRGDALYVLEFGNQRVQKLSLDGRPLAVLGQPGRGDGCFAAPWRCAAARDALWISDTDNSRVVKLEASF